MDSEEIQPLQNDRAAARRPSRFLLALESVVRIALGLIMILYGLQKITNQQIQLSAWDYARPLIKVPGTALTWAFLGYQPWFQCLTGLMEALPGLMLLSRRFWRLGALLVFPVILNVALINWAMDLWFDTRILSLFLLALDVFLISRCLPAYLKFFHALTPRPAPIQSRVGSIAAGAVFPVTAVIGIGAYLVLMNLPYTRAIREEADLIGIRQINGAGTWIVEQATIDGHEVPGGTDRKLYFDFFSKCIFTAPGQELKGTFKSSHTTHTLEITGVALAGDSSTIQGTYQIEGKQIFFYGEQNHKPVQMTLKKWGWGPALPFHS